MLWGVHQHYGVESSYVLGQTVFNVMYFIQADSHLWSHITRELSKLGDCTSKIICTRVVKLLISQWAVVWPAYFTSCQNSFTCLHHGHLGSLCGNQTSRVSSMVCVSMPCHGIGWPWLCQYITVWLTWYKKKKTEKKQVYTYWSQMLKKFHRLQLPLSHPGHCGERADYELLCVSV